MSLAQRHGREDARMAPHRRRARTVAVVVGLLAALISSSSTAWAGDDYPYASAPYCTSGPGCTDPWGFYYRQCTSFVAWRMNRDGVAFTNFMAGPNGTRGQWGDGGNWADNARQIGYPVDGVPAPGAIAQWTGADGGVSASGHVAYVEAVNPDGSQVVEEYNALVRGGWDRRTVRAPRFIHVHGPVSAGGGPTAGAGTAMAGRAYFAEGTTRPGFADYLTVLNPRPDPLSVLVEYDLAGGGRPLSRQLVVAGFTASVVNVAADVGPGQDVSVALTAPVPFAAARTMYVDAGFPATGPVTGITQLSGMSAPGTRWDFAEGSTLPGFQEYLTLQNPSDTTAAVAIAYAVEGPAGPSSTTTIPPHTRITVDVGDPAQAGRGQTGVAAEVVSTNGVPVLAERPLYFHRDLAGTGAPNDGAHVAAGALPGADWLFAEGTLLDGWDEYLTLYNPNPQPAQATIDYLLEWAPPVSRSLEVAPTSRRTVPIFDLADPAAVGRSATNAPSKGVSVHVGADSPLVAERPVYAEAALRPHLVVNDGHDAPGSAFALACARFADAEVNGANIAYLTLANPAPIPVDVAIVSYRAGQRAVSAPLRVAPASRLTVDLAPYQPAPATARAWDSFGFDVTATAGGNFAAEEPQYLADPSTLENGASVAEPVPC